MTECSSDLSLVKTVELTAQQGKDMLIFPLGTAVSVHVHDVKRTGPSPVAKQPRRPSAKCFVSPCKRSLHPADNAPPLKQARGSVGAVVTVSGKTNSVVEDYLKATEKLKKKKEQLRELESRLASAKKTEGQTSLKPLTDKWRNAIIECLRAFHDHELCPRNPDNGERVSIQVLAQNLVEADLEHLGINPDDLDE